MSISEKSAGWMFILALLVCSVLLPVQVHFDDDFLPAPAGFDLVDVQPQKAIAVHTSSQNPRCVSEFARNSFLTAEFGHILDSASLTAQQDSSRVSCARGIRFLPLKS